MFDHRGDDVPQGESRRKYLTNNKWKTDLGNYCLPACLHVYKDGHEEDDLSS